MDGDQAGREMPEGTGSTAGGPRVDLRTTLVYRHRFFPIKKEEKCKFGSCGCLTFPFCHVCRPRWSDAVTNPLILQALPHFSIQSPLRAWHVALSPLCRCGAVGVTPSPGPLDIWPRDRFQVTSRQGRGDSASSR